jgi:hypothetical protein
MTHKNEELKHLGHNLNQEFYCHVLEFLGNWGNLKPCSRVFRLRRNFIL